MTSKTAEVLEAIKQDAMNGQEIAPAMFTAFYPRGNVSAAFRAAKRNGIIVKAHDSCAGTPVYRASCSII